MEVQPRRYASLTPDSRRRLRAEYAEAQGWACLHCKASLLGQPSPEVQRKRVTAKLFPKNFFDHPVHLHHDHKTGMTLGAVHARCNAVRAIRDLP